MGRFVEIAIDAGAIDRASGDAIVRACPVDVFALDAAGRLAAVEHNEDECILCGRCVELAAGAVTVRRRYGAGREVPAGGGSDG
ncbi:MAG TPA: ferredoxin family protein [Solirubrobacteraceae bacterium]|jgi:NAD-dependent dihydropyrimidine dehydrogenase PreA subunit|nr:ferredoxin family protein [Solirubrobacteraceae bacterium]